MRLITTILIFSFILETISVPVNNVNVKVFTDLAHENDPACTSGVTRIQQVEFHQHSNYSGDYHSFCSNNPDIQSIPGHHQTARIFCVERGVWIIDFSSNDIPNKVGILASGNLGKICLTFPPELKISFTGVRHLAAVDLSTSVLSLYKDRFKGAEFRLDGREVRLPRPIEIASFGLTGKESLTLYSGIDFDGQAACIIPGKNDPLLSGVTFSDIVPLEKVGSVRRGCSLEARLLEGTRTLKESRSWSSVEGDPQILSRVKIEKF